MKNRAILKGIWKAAEKRCRIQRCPRNQLCFFLFARLSESLPSKIICCSYFKYKNFFHFFLFFPDDSHADNFFGPSNSAVQLHEFAFNKLPFLHISVKAPSLNSSKVNALLI